MTTPKPQCSEPHVYSKRDSWHSHQCPKSGVVEEGGKRWCKYHAPSAREARLDARSKKLHDDWYICRKPEHEAFGALLAAAEAVSRALHEFHPREHHIAVDQGICTWKPCQALFNAVALAKKKEAQP